MDMKKIAESMKDLKAAMNVRPAGWLLVLLLLVPGGSILAQKLDSTGNHGHHGRREGRYGIPNLTDNQRKQISALRTPLSKELLPLTNLLSEKKAHLKTLQTSEKADLNAINSTIDEISQLQTQIMKKRAAHTQAIRKILTDDQRIAFDMRGSSERKSFHRRNRSHYGNGG
jgi:Spy/CpxP family protein refolding chaperone